MAKPFCLPEEFERALGEIRTRVSLYGDTTEPAPSSFDLAVALSGGLDSSVLLDLAYAYVAQHGGRLLAFHVHHGLSPNADQWLAHCRAQCAALGIPFDVRHVEIDQQQRTGIEEAARNLRYAALGSMCREHGIDLLLTAHHQDDQAETVLLQLLRGSGVAGLSGMDRANRAPDLLGDHDLWMARPLLDVSRADLEAWARKKKITHVHDESNSDLRYARNALRHQVMPAIAQAFPGFQQRFVRTAQHAQSAQRLLVELAAQDLQACLDGDCLDVRRLRGFSQDRIDNLLRYWFGVRGVRMPSTAWLNEMRSQLFEAKDDAQLCVTHADCEIHRYRHRVFLTPRIDPESLLQGPQPFRWNGESSLVFPAFGGVLHIEPAEQGMDGEWLRQQSLRLALRNGGEVLKPAWNRPTRNLKAHYQSCDVPPWERMRLPLVFSESQLLYAAGIGMDCHALAEGAGERLQFRWAFVP